MADEVEVKLRVFEAIAPHLTRLGFTDPDSVNRLVKAYSSCILDLPSQKSDYQSASTPKRRGRPPKQVAPSED